MHHRQSGSRPDILADRRILSSRQSSPYPWRIPLYSWQHDRPEAVERDRNERPGNSPPGRWFHQCSLENYAKSVLQSLCCVSERWSYSVPWLVHGSTWILWQTSGSGIHRSSDGHIKAPWMQHFYTLGVTLTQKSLNSFYTWSFAMICACPLTSSTISTPTKRLGKLTRHFQCSSFLSGICICTESCSSLQELCANDSSHLILIFPFPLPLCQKPLLGQSDLSLRNPNFISGHFLKSDIIPYLFFCYISGTVFC